MATDFLSKINAAFESGFMAVHGHRAAKNMDTSLAVLVHDAIVYDEKVQKAVVFSNQRRRWLSEQLHYFRRDFLNSLIALFTRGNVDYFDKVIQFIQPPRILLLEAVIFAGLLFPLINLFVGLP